MDLKKARDISLLIGEIDYLEMLVREMSCSLDRCRESRDVRTTVTIPSRWLPSLIDVAMRDIDEFQKGVEAL